MRYTETVIPYTEEEKLVLQTLFADALWLEDADYPVFFDGVYDWLPPEEEYLYDESA